MARTKQLFKSFTESAINRVSLLLLLHILSFPADAAGVKLEKLEDFDKDTHKMAVNINVDIHGRCIVDHSDLDKAFKGLLGIVGFQTAPMGKSQLEFAVSIKGFEASAEQPCGLRILSMVRQIPDIKMLRLSPGSTSTRYRLWSTENVITESQSQIQSSIQEQARKDVMDFLHSFAREE